MTAVEWLIDELTRLGHNFKLYKKEIEQAKEMEKQQIIDFAVWFNNRNNEYQSYENIAEQFYNETFNK